MTYTPERSMSDDQQTLLERVLLDLASSERPNADARAASPSEHHSLPIPEEGSTTGLPGVGERYFIYLRLPFRPSGEAFAAALCAAAEMAWGICQKYPFQKQNFDRFWEGFRPRRIFFDTREYAANEDDWSEAVFLGFVPEDTFNEDDRTIVLFLSKLLLSAFSAERGDYLIGNGAIERFTSSRAIALSSEDSARVMKILRHAGTKTYH